MKILKLISLALVLIALLVFMPACSPPAGTTDEQAAAPLGIACQAFYRPSVGQRPDDGTVINLGGHGDSGTATYADMVFDAQLSDDPGEGPSLLISVTAKDSGGRILSQLYQIDRAKGLRNQFVGGHGFTGLAYVYHPASTAELQYFCGVDAQ